MGVLTSVINVSFESFLSFGSLVAMRTVQGYSYVDSNLTAGLVWYGAGLVTSKTMTK